MSYYQIMYVLLQTVLNILFVMNKIFNSHSSFLIHVYQGKEKEHLFSPCTLILKTHEHGISLCCQLIPTLNIISKPCYFITKWIILLNPPCAANNLATEVEEGGVGGHKTHAGITISFAKICSCYFFIFSSHSLHWLTGLVKSPLPLFEGFLISLLIQPVLQCLF